MSEVGPSDNSGFKKPDTPDVSPAGKGRGGFHPRNSPGNDGGRRDQGNAPGMSNRHFQGNQDHDFRTPPHANGKERRNRSHSGDGRRRNSFERRNSQERYLDSPNSQERGSNQQWRNNQQFSNNQQWNRSPHSNIGQGYNGGYYYNSSDGGDYSQQGSQSDYSNSPRGRRVNYHSPQEQRNWRGSNQSSPEKRGRGRNNSQFNYSDFSSDGQTPERNRYRWDEDSDVFLSKTLSSILRHNAERFGFQLMKGGFLYVDDILKYVHKLHGYTPDDVRRIVDSNDKKRFALETEGDRLKIRANQGHSIQVEDLDLTPISSADEVPMVIHGTYYTSWELIKKTGLRRMNRNHIHFAAGEPGENGVISGMRKTCEVMIHIDMEKALKDGLKFYRSANNVILCSGDENGVIYPCYFSGVLDRLRYHRMEYDPTISSSTAVEEKPTESKKRKKKNKRKDKQEEAVTEPREERSEEPVTKEPEDGATTDDSSLPAAKKQHVSQPETPDTQTVDSSQTETVAVETNRNENDDVENDEVKSKDWIEPNLINDAAVSQYFVKQLCENPPSHIAVSCVGENLGQKDSRIRTIVITSHPNSYVYHLHDENRQLVKEGHLDQLLIDKQINKVFHDIGAVSTSLIREFDVLMDGTPIWDISMMFSKVTPAQMDLEELKCSKGMFKKWTKQNEDYGKIMSKVEGFDAMVVSELLERGKLMSDLYRLCSQKLDENLVKKLRKEIYEAAIPRNGSVDEDLAKKIEALKLERKPKKTADKPEGASQQQSQQQQQQKQQQKQHGKGKSGKGKKK